MVFRSISVRLTWHSHGLLQVDYNDKQERMVETVENFVEELLGFVYPESI